MLESLLKAPSGGLRQFLPAQLELLSLSLELYVESISTTIIKQTRQPWVPMEIPLTESARVRLERCKAFGRDLDRPQKPHDGGQYGLYGTAAALELLAASKEAEQFELGRKPALNPQTREWAGTFVTLWNFLSFAVCELGKDPHQKWWKQNRIILRNCNILRALASLPPRLVAIAKVQQQIPAIAVSELHSDLTGLLSAEAVSNVAKVVLRQIQDARTSYADVPAEYHLRFPTEVSTPDDCVFRFANGAHNLPGTWNQWLFLASSVLIAVVRAYGADIIDDVKNIYTAANFACIIRKLRDEDPSHIDDRVRLFALYALSHIENGDPNLVPEGLGMGLPERDWFVSEVASTCRRLMKSEVALMDAHIPYEVLFSKPGGAEHHDDYFVVPVVPILLYLLAIYKPRWLFKPRLKSIINAWCHASALNTQRLDEIPLVLPHQIGEYNGTVNTLYYREAALAIVEAVRKRRRRGWLYGALGYAEESPRSFTLLVFSLITFTTAAALQAGGTSDAFRTVVISLLVAWLARIIYDGVKKFLGY